MVTGPEGEVFLANPAACRLLGRDEAEIIRLGRAAAVDPDDPAVLRALEIRRQTGAFQGEITFVRRDGTRFPVELTTAVYQHPGTGPRTVLVFRDITERKRIMDRMELSEEKFARIFYSSPDGITITKQSDGSYLEINPGFAATSGYEPHEVLGRTPVELGFWTDDQERGRFVNELRTKGEVVNREMQFRFKGGRIRTTLVSARFIDIGGVPCILSITRDITERKVLEESLLRTQKLDSVGLLAGGIAHDFNNMLGGLLGFLELAQEMASQGRHDKVETYLTKAIGIFPRARGLTRQLLTFSKGGEPVRTTVNLGPLVRSSTTFALSGANVLAEFDIPDDLWLCECDETQIGQVIDNLVLNAVQSMPQGGVVRLAAENVVTIPGHAGRFVKVSVSDQGPGISEELMPRLFEPFFTTKESGHGLGLATSFSIASRHDGWLEVSSVPGNGATFRLVLPATSQTEEPPDQGGSEITHRGQGSILVMDDNPHVLEVTGHWLETMGYTVESCHDCSQALEAYLRGRSQGVPFRAAILDLTIPGVKGGIELARRLAQEDPTLPLIAITGYSESPVMARPLDFGFQGKLAKPFHRKDLVVVLNLLLKD